MAKITSIRASAGEKIVGIVDGQTAFQLVGGQNGFSALWTDRTAFQNCGRTDGFSALIGVTLSDNLEWKTHHDIILSKAYKTLGLVRRTFSSSIPPLTKVKLYVSLIRSQLMYCSPIWRPYLVKDISNLEHLQRQATKYILNDYISDYKISQTRAFPINVHL